MAFTLNTFQFGRGTTTTPSNGGGVSTVIHGYKSTDSSATVLTGGYFPNNIDGSTTSDKIFDGDLLVIVASDLTSMHEVTGTSPFTLGSDLLQGAGSPVVMAAPVAATDANGITISGTTIHMEIADATHPGIVTAFDQVFGGTKTLNAGARFLTFGGSSSILNYYEEADYTTTFTNNAQTTNAVTFKVVRIGNAVIIRSGTIGSAAPQGAPVARFTANTLLPAKFRPANEIIAPWFVSNGGVYKIGAINITAAGEVFIYNDPNLTTAYTAAQILTVGVSTVSYVV